MPSHTAGQWQSRNLTPGTVCFQVCSLCTFLSCLVPHLVQRTQVQLEASRKYLDFWNKLHSGKVTMTNSIFSPWQGWKRAVMRPQVRAGALEKDWLGVGLWGNASFPSLPGYIFKSLPLSGPPHTRQMGALSLPTVHAFGPAKSPSPKSEPTFPSSRKLQAINFMLPQLFLHSAP